MQFTINQVSKYYRRNHCVLDNLNMQFDSKRVGILGPSGSGKSTLANILATIINPTKGTVTFNNVDLSRSSCEFRSLLGYLPQNFGVYSTLTAVEYMKYIAALKWKNYSITQNTINSVLDAVDFSAVKGSILGTLSTGMKQKLGVAQMLLTNPKVFIVDELNNSMTLDERKEILRLLHEQTKNKTLLLVSGQADDFQGLVDEIVVLVEGKLMLKTTPSLFLESVKNKVWEMTIPNSNLSVIRRKYVTTKTEHTREGVHIRCLSEKEPSGSSYSVEPTLHDAYIDYLNKLNGSVQ